MGDERIREPKQNIPRAEPDGSVSCTDRFSEGADLRRADRTALNPHLG
nr:MAG TPA: hypothetical protein [Caudoviricetes sp.]